ncbi:MAG: hypothetical protein KAJ98_00085 [Spirochaetaceae bacterium]|nr:hypothetical protein [Spirochaetaceae bacterium]
MAEMPKEGFLKIVAPKRTPIDPAHKAALIRKGNELFNDGKVPTAKKIFLTLGYSDGIIRAGDYHYKKGEYWEAYRLYSLAPAPAKVDYMIERMAGVVREWISE